MTEYRGFFIKYSNYRYSGYRIFIGKLKATGKRVIDKALRDDYWNGFWDFSTEAGAKRVIDTLCDPTHPDHQVRISCLSKTLQKELGS